MDSQRKEAGHLQTRVATLILPLASFVSSYRHRANRFIRVSLLGILPKLSFNTEQPVPDMNNFIKNDKNSTLATHEIAS